VIPSFFNRQLRAKRLTGFIGLVVGLGVLAIASSVAVWFFWRRYKRNKQAPYGQSSGTFPKPGGGLFGRKKGKGWMQTQSFTEGGDEDAIRMDAQRRQQYGHHPNESTASVGVPTRGRVYDDPFNADSLDNLQRETSAAIDHGPEYQRIATGGERPTSPSPISPPLAGGTRFHEGL
jgi:hypothetical protein